MAINTYPNYSNYQVGFTIGTTALSSWTTDPAEDTAVGYYTINQNLPAGIYNSFATVSGSTIYFSTTVTNSLFANPSWNQTGYQFQGVFSLTTTNSFIRVKVPTLWKSSTLNIGTTGVNKILIGNNNILINGVWLSTSNSSTTGAELRIYTTTDKISWTQQTYYPTAVIPPLGANYAIWDGSYFMIADMGTNLKISTNAVTWGSRAVPFTPRFISYANGNYVIWMNSSNSAYAVSTDAVNWTTRTGVGLPGTLMNGVLYHSTSGQYIVYGLSGALFSSTNLTNWTTRYITGANGNYNAGTVGGGFITLYSGSTVVASTDALTWSTKITYGNTSYNSIYDNGYHIYGNTGNPLVLAFGDAVYNSGYRPFNLPSSNSGLVAKANGSYMSADAVIATTSFTHHWSTSLAGAPPTIYSLYIESKTNTNYTNLSQ